MASAAADQAVKPRAGGKPSRRPAERRAWPSTASARIGCDGSIDEVRISRVLRTIDPAAQGRPEAGRRHRGPVAVRRLRPHPRRPGVDAAARSAGEAWERMTDVDWVDPRLRRWTPGRPSTAPWRIRTAASGAGLQGRRPSASATRARAAVIFDRGQLRMAAGWTGGFLNHSDRRFGLLNTPTPDGKLLFSTASGPGWADPRGECRRQASGDRAAAARVGPLQRPVPARQAGRAVLHRGTASRCWSRPGWRRLPGQTVLTRTFEVGPSTHGCACSRASWPAQHVYVRQEPRPTQAATRSAAWSSPDRRRRGRASLLRQLFAATSERVQRSPGEALDAGKGGDAPAPTLAAWTRPGPPRWTKEIVTKARSRRTPPPTSSTR